MYITFYIVHSPDTCTHNSPMIYDAEANTLATKKTTPTEPPNSGPNARLIMTSR